VNNSPNTQARHEFLSGIDPLAAAVDDLMGGKSMGIMQFQTGTCHGQYRICDAVELITIINEEPGNGDFQKAMGWFESIAVNEHKDLRVVEIFNNSLKNNLAKHGYRVKGKKATKSYKKMRGRS